MKNSKLTYSNYYGMIRVLSILFVSLIQITGADASHLMGGDLTYREIDTSIGRYRFTLTLYRDCSGIQFGGETLKVRTATVNTSIPLSTIAAVSEVTPICLPPDVASKPVTNCPSGPVGSYRGVERWVYTADYTLGKNVGWAYVGYGACCRNTLISTILSPSSSGLWIQAVINTNYRNNSPVFVAPPIPQWCKLMVNNYNHGAVDSFDPKFITLANGVSTMRDSMSYRLYAPFTGEAANANSAVNLGNPSVTFVGSLNQNNFVFTTSGVNFDPQTGSVSCIPSMEQDAIMAMAVQEWRAIPNGNGYTRVLVGYVCREVQFAIRNTCPPISILGAIPDSTRNAVFTSSSTLTTEVGRKNINISVKFIGAANNSLFSRVHLMPSNALFQKVQYSQVKTSGGGVDTIVGSIKIDSVLRAGEDQFVLELYHCAANGTKQSQFYNVKIQSRNGSCASVGDTPIFSNLNIRRVTISGGLDNLDNETPCNSHIGTQGTGTGIAGRYSNFITSTVPKTKLIKSSTFNLEIKDTACMTGIHYYTKVAFLDWNKNNDFTDAGERYNISASPFNTPTENINITIPSNTPLGLTKMRIVTRMDTPSSNLMPCGPSLNSSMNQGETEDYEIEIIENFGDCKIYKQVNYTKIGKKFHFVSSGPANVIAPYTVRYNWTFSNGSTSTVKNPILDSLPHGKLHWAKLVVCVDSGTKTICCDSSRLDSIDNCLMNSFITRNLDTLKANPIGGIPPYSYLWSNGGAGKTIITNATGTYFSFVTDSIGCIAQSSFNVQGISTLCTNYKNFNWLNIGGNQYNFFNVPNIPSGLNPTYSWNFGNGQTSTLAQPTVTLNASSTYQVKLVYCLRDTSMNSICCDSILKMVVTPNPNSGIPCNITPNFSWTSLNDGTINFQDSTHPNIGQMYTYHWTFGDGTTSTQKNPTKVYSTNGNKLVCLRIRRWLNGNNLHCEDTVCKTINVTNVVPCNRLMPKFSFQSLGMGQYSFQNQTNMSNFTLVSASYQIFPTGTTYSTPNATHTFTTIGTYNVVFTITAFDVLSGMNCTRSTSMTLFVNPSLCGCFKAFNNSTVFNRVANFTNTSACVDTNTKYLYKFGNGDTSSNPNPTYTYPLPGLYRTVMYISRTKNGNTCIDSFVRILQVTSNHPCKDSGYAVYFNYNCPPFINPVCGCDSITYSNYCEAGKKGVKLYTNGPCKNDTSFVKICGYVINDINRNCSHDTTDIGINNIAIRFNTTPPSYAYTNSSGYYQIYLRKGTYTLTQQLGFTNPAIAQLCPSSNASITVNTTTGGMTYCNNNFYDTTNTCPDLSVSIGRFTNITPGFWSRKIISYRNRGATTISGVVLKYRFLSSLTVRSFTTPTYSVSGNVLTWNLGSLPPYSNGSKIAEFDVPVSLPLGTTVIDSVWIEPVSGDCNTANNHAIFHDTCVGSWDPNDKAATPANNIDTGVKVIDYHIRFQNTGTAPAHNVRIEDKIDNNFEKASLKVLDYSHKMNHYFDDNGKLYFEFPNIMLPDSGTDYEASQGFVTYTIHLKKGLAVGTKLMNTAEIYFDFNEPVITNTTVNTITLKSSGSLNLYEKGMNVILYPNPTKNFAHLKIDLDRQSSISYSLFDIHGRTVLNEKRIERHQGQYSDELNLEYLPSGVYILNLKVNDRETSIKLFKE